MNRVRRTIAPHRMPGLMPVMRWDQGMKSLSARGPLTRCVILAAAVRVPSRLLRNEQGLQERGKRFFPLCFHGKRRVAPDPGWALWSAGAIVLYASQVALTVVLFAGLQCALPGGGSGAARAGRPGEAVGPAWRGTVFRLKASGGRSEALFQQPARLFHLRRRTALLDVALRWITPNAIHTYP